MNVYDFDKTIYNGDSTFDFYLYCLRKKPHIIRHIPKQAISMLKYVLKKTDKTKMKENFYVFFNSIDTKSILEDFWKTHIHKINSWYIDQKQETDVIISASPEFLLETPIKHLNIKTLIASKVDYKTGKTSGQNCYGEEKVKRFYEVFPNAEILNFYSDSESDKPLAMIAKNSFIVKGNEIKKWL